MCNFNRKLWSKTHIFGYMEFNYINEEEYYKYYKYKKENTVSSKKPWPRSSSGQVQLRLSLIIWETLGSSGYETYSPVEIRVFGLDLFHVVFQVFC